MNASRTPGPIAQATAAKLEELDEALAWTRRAKPSTQESEAVRAAERELLNAKSLLTTTVVDIEGLSEKLDDMRFRLDAITKKALDRNIATCREAFVRSESRRSRVEQSLAELKSSPQHQSGDGMAWLFCIMFVIGTIALLHFLLSDPPVWLQVLAAIVAWIVGGLAKNPIVDYRHSTKVKNEALAAIDQCMKEMQSSNREEEEWKQEMRRFTTWQGEHSRREARTA